MKLSKVAGRVAVYVPDHPKANNRGYVLRYRLVMEEHLGRYLREDEEVHHLNEDPTDDRLENLEVMSIAEHARLHAKARRKLDYDKIRELRQWGFGHKRIAKMLGYPRSSVQKAVGIIEGT